MKTLPPFGSVKECPKCGEPSPVKCWHDPGGESDEWRGTPPSPEHMERQCVRCGYEWAEACKDAGEEVTE